jgi:hypothetical protein
MQVTQKMEMREYDPFAKQFLPNKTPDWSSSDPRRRLGDSIYDFSSEPPTIRPSCHDERHMETDLAGRYALLSERFWYFGDRPQSLPVHLREIVKEGPGHRSKSNEPFFAGFLEWLDGLPVEPNSLHGNPQDKLVNLSGVPIGQSDTQRLSACGSCTL